MDSVRRRRKSSDSNSQEFEFWMVRNPSFPQPNLLTADELFVDGVLLPLHLLSNRQSYPPEPNLLTDPEPQSRETGVQEPEHESVPELRQLNSTNGLTSSKRWKDIFKKGEKKTTTKNAEDKVKEKEKEKKREKKSQTAASSAELNINIWPFSRSRSAGNSGTRPRMVSGAPGTRKVSSAPCSRSNSAGESKSRKWPSSPSRAGVHVGRSSPIWQVKRGGSGVTKSSEAAIRSVEKLGGKKESRIKLSGNNNGGKVRVLNLNVNVPMCIGYRHHLSCRSDENGAIGVVGIGSNKSSSSSNNNNNSSGVTGVDPATGAGGGGGNHNVSNSGNYLFNFLSLFTKKVY